jgi:hypothetical protein
MGIMDIIKNLIAGVPSAPAETLADNATGSPELYAECISKLLTSEGHSFITIDRSEDESIVQVEKEDDILSLVISPYPYAEHPDAKLAELGITLPQGSTMEIWDAKRYCEYLVPVSALNELADTIDSVFKKMYGNADGYAVSVTMMS